MTWRTDDTAADRFYRLLLIAYPSRFRRDFGDDMVQLFRDRRRDGDSGFGHWARVAGDVLRQAFLERTQRQVRHRYGYAPSSGRGPNLDGDYGNQVKKDWTQMFDTTRQDIGYALRMFVKNPTFTVIAIVTLALGIGVNTAIFSLINGVVLQPLQFGEPGDLAVVWETSALEGVETSETAVGTFLDWREKNEAFEDVTAWTWDTFVLQEEDDSEVLDGVWVYPNFFSVLQFNPMFGRTFVMDDAPAGVRSNVVLISHTLWRDRWGANPGVVGQTIRLDGNPATIIGVMRPDVAAPEANVDIWVAAGFQSPTRWERHQRRYNILARLKPDVTIGQAQADMSRISADLRAGQYSDIYEGWDAIVVPLREEVVGDVRATLTIAFVSVGLVLLIACVNIANMLLARASARQREIAVRSALGAGKGRITRQLLTESLILAFAGGLAGVVVALFTHKLLLAFEPGIIPRAEELSIDLLALVFAVTVALFTGFVFGLVPALQGTRFDLHGALKQGGAKGMTASKGHSRLRGGLVAAQLALATVLLCGAGLLIRSMMELGKVDPGFDYQQTAAARIFLDGNRFRDQAAVDGYYQEVQQRLADLPGIDAVGASSALPMDPMGIGYDLPYRLEGQGGLSGNQLPAADFRVVTPGYFDAMGIPLRSGRRFTTADRSGTIQVMLVNEAMAEQAWPGKDPVGQVINTPSTNWNEFEVVGVVGNTRYYGLDSEPQPEMYVVLGQVPRNTLSLVVRTARDPALIVDAVRREIIAHDPAMPAHSVIPLADLISETVAAERFYALVLGVFAAVALALSAVGIYGVLSYWVNQRTSEIGLRIALGASASGVRRLVVGHGMSFTGIGVLIGLAGAVVSTRVLSNVLFGVGTADPLTFVGVTVVLATIALVACWLPAFRASRVDPVTALREE